MFAQRAPNASLDSGLSRTLKAAVLSSVIVLALTAAANGASLDAAAINTAEWRSTKEPPGKISPLIIKAQVLLARARFSPGEIDGRPGENYKKALRAYAEQNGGNSDELNSELWQKLNATSAEPATIDYAISSEDVAGPFLSKLPKKMEAMKHLPRLSYTSARERIAGKFQMSEELLAALNPKRKFDEAGVTVTVLNAAAPKLPARVTRVQIDKDTQMLRAFGGDGTLLAAYPVTAGSAEKPTPSETLKVTSINKNPTYRYNPAYAFKGVKSRKPFTINPGPNNPVGVVWIGLSSEGYGIHGTPEPGKISKTESHGCVRLTNWDALQLAVR
jgi:lipoprotein-anchoring transpeptidase ErfK/SrfK